LGGRFKAGVKVNGVLRLQGNRRKCGRVCSNGYLAKIRRTKIYAMLRFHIPNVQTLLVVVTACYVEYQPFFIVCDGFDTQDLATQGSLGAVKKVSNHESNSLPEQPYSNLAKPDSLPLCSGVG
jgi:hypothetical protein